MDLKKKYKPITKKVPAMTDKQAASLRGSFNMGMDKKSGGTKSTTRKKK